MKSQCFSQCVFRSYFNADQASAIVNSTFGQSLMIEMLANRLDFTYAIALALAKKRLESRASAKAQSDLKFRWIPDMILKTSLLVHRYFHLLGKQCLLISWFLLLHLQVEAWNNSLSSDNTISFSADSKIKEKFSRHFRTFFLFWRQKWTFFFIFGAKNGGKTFLWSLSQH